MPELVSDLAPTEDDRLMQAEAIVRAYCGWHIAPSRTETVRLRGDSRASIILPSLHVTDVASVTIGSVLADPTTYDWGTNGVISMRYRGNDYDPQCHWGYAAVTVTYTHGYIDPPADVSGVVQAMAKRAMDSATQQVSQVGQVIFSQPGVLLTLHSQQDEIKVLDRYRLPKSP
jgi:hypothetical protein